MDPFHNLDHNQSASLVLCRSLEACNVQNGAVIDLPVVVLIGGGRLFSTLLSVMLSIAVLTNEV